MSNQEIKELQERIKLIARKMGFDDYQDDIAQQVMVNWLNNANWKQTIKFAIIDAMRQIRPRSRGRSVPTTVSLEYLYDKAS
jgi:hypothetical protein